MAEEELRQAAKEGDIASVRKLLIAGTKQTENEVDKTLIFYLLACSAIVLDIFTNISFIVAGLSFFLDVARSSGNHSKQSQF